MPRRREGGLVNIEPAIRKGHLPCPCNKDEEYRTAEKEDIMNMMYRCFAFEVL